MIKWPHLYLGNSRRTGEDYKGKSGRSSLLLPLGYNDRSDVGPQPRLSKMRYFSHWANLKPNPLGQTQGRTGGWAVRAEGGWGRAARSMPLRGGQVGSLKKGSLAVPGLQERQRSGRLLSGSRRAKVVRDSSKASIQCHDLMATSMIRRHLTREGRQLGCDRDSPPSPTNI